MIHDVHVHLLPNLFEPEEFRGGVAVILDILRASTTIVHALAHGAARVIPTGEIAEARRVAGGLPVGSVLLGGEREGLQIEGFDLDNSPFAYTPELVKGRTIVFTTTNGTRALLRSDRADRVLIGSFVNLQAVVDDLAQEDRPVHLVCAGDKGESHTGRHAVRRGNCRAAAGTLRPARCGVGRRSVATGPRSLPPAGCPAGRSAAGAAAGVRRPELPAAGF